jgi:hypothetical protein
MLCFLSSSSPRIPHPSLCVIFLLRNRSRQSRLVVTTLQCYAAPKGRLAMLLYTQPTAKRIMETPKNFSAVG